MTVFRTVLGPKFSKICLKLAKWCIISIVTESVRDSFQVSGPYLTQYEVYYKRLDPEAKGEIGAMDAAKFLKNSGLADEFLGKVRKDNKGLRFVVLRLIQRLFELDH